MSQAYRYVKSACCICKKRHDCTGWRKIELGEAIDRGTLIVMANCYRWDPEKKEGEK